MHDGASAHPGVLQRPLDVPDVIEREIALRTHPLLTALPSPPKNAKTPLSCLLLVCTVTPLPMPTQTVAATQPYLLTLSGDAELVCAHAFCALL